MADVRADVRVEIAAAIVLMAAAVFALFWLVPNHTEPASSELDIAPAFFPMLAAGVVLVLSFAMIVVRLTRQVTSSVELSGKTILREAALWCATGVLIWFALPVIGLISTSILVVLLGGFVTGYKRWWVLATLAVVFSVLVDFGAWQIFTVDLP